MKFSLLLISLILSLLLSACSYSAPGATQGVPSDTEVPSPLTPQENTPKPESDLSTEAIVTYGGEYDFTPPIYYETVFPSCYYTEPEAEFARASNDCEMLLLPTEYNAAPVWTLNKGDCVRLLSKTDSTWDKFEFVMQSWYFVCVVSGDGEDSPYIGWVKAEQLTLLETPYTSGQSFSAENLTRYGEVSGISYIAPSYRQGIVINGCELSLLPGGEAMKCLAKNSYVEILAAGLPKDGNELWLYVRIASYEAESPQCLWVSENEIKPYTSENMFEIIDNLRVSPTAQAYWENGTVVLGDTYNLCLYFREDSPEGTRYWLRSGGGILLYVNSLDDLLYPVPIK